MKDCPAMQAVIILFLLIIFISVIIALLQLVCLQPFVKGHRRICGSKKWCPFISILKPVKGIDDGAFENFASFCEQDYPCFEIIFGIKNKNDPVIPLIEKLRREYPDVQIKLVVSNNRIGLNPKINNLENAYRESSGEIIILSDSDVRVDKNYLSAIVEPLRKNEVGVVTNLSIFKGAKGFFSGVSNLAYNSLMTLFLIPAKFDRLSLACGSSMAIKRGVLEEIGGFKPVADIIPEDTYMSYLVIDRGYKIRTSSRPVFIVKERSCFSNEYDHGIRWMLNVKKHSIPLMFLAPIFFPMPFALLCYLYYGGNTSLLLLLITIISRYSVISLISLKLVKDKNLINYFPWVPVAEAFALIFWLIAFAVNRVRWRGMEYMVRKGGRLEMVIDELESERIADFTETH